MKITPCGLDKTMVENKNGGPEGVRRLGERIFLFSYLLAT